MGDIVGDFLGDLSGRARGGNPNLPFNTYQPDTRIFGDVRRSIRNDARGGDDVVSVNDALDAVLGDSSAIQDEGQGGNDTIFLAPRITHVACGDGYSMSGSSIGGRDTLIISSPLSDEDDPSVGTLFGDAYLMTGKLSATMTPSCTKGSEPSISTATPSS